MNKAELIQAVANSTGLSKAEATRAVDAVVDAIANSLKKGQQVAVVGFGTFSVKHRAARAGRNPRTGETIQLFAANVPGFRPGKALKEAVAGESGTDDPGPSIGTTGRSRGTVR